MIDTRFDIEWRWTERRAEQVRVEPRRDHPEVKRWVAVRQMLAIQLFLALLAVGYTLSFAPDLHEVTAKEPFFAVLLGLGLVGGVPAVGLGAGWLLRRAALRRLVVERTAVVERTLGCTAVLRVAHSPVPTLAVDLGPEARGQVLSEREVQGSASTAITGAQSAVPTPTIDLERAVVHLARNPAGEVVAEFRRTDDGARLGVVVGLVGPNGASEFPLIEREAARVIDTAGFLDALVLAADAAGLRLPERIRQLEAAT